MAMQTKMPAVCEHGVLREMRCSQCERAQIPIMPPQHQQPVQQKPTNIVVMLKDNAGVVNVPIADPVNFNFPMWVALVRGNGAVLTEGVYIPQENILLCAMGEVQVQPAPGKKQQTH